MSEPRASGGGIVAEYIDAVRRIVERRGGELLLVHQAGVRVLLTGRHRFGLVSTWELAIIERGWALRVNDAGKASGPKTPCDIAEHILGCRHIRRRALGGKP